MQRIDRSINYRNVSLYFQVAFYLLAGLNHFRNPDFYLPLIPAYLPEREIINWVSGIAEVILAICLMSDRLRNAAAWGIVTMLIAFIPSHVYFIQIGSCIDQGLCVSPIISWARLLIVHPLLIWWALSAYKSTS